MSAANSTFIIPINPYLLKKKMRTLFILLLSFATLSCQAQEPARVQVEVDLATALQDDQYADGRLFLFFSENLEREPRQQLWPISTKKNHIYARNMHWTGEEPIRVRTSANFSKTAPFDLHEIPPGTYAVQALWDQDTEESRIDAPGNLFSQVQQITIDGDQSISLTIDQQVPPRTMIDDKHVVEISMRSDLLSDFHGKDVIIKASLLLPSGYFDNVNATYPVRYNVAGYGGRYTRLNRYFRPGSDFRNWWLSGDAPQVLCVYLDGEGPYGDSYQLDSDNNGPYGQMLTEELIPYIEAEYRGRQDATYRFVDGCSTGGWVSLALQLFYPDVFNGVFSYSPDAIAFSDYQLINVYEDENAFYNEWGNPHPLARDITGDPMVHMDEFIRYENVLGASDTYVNSGGQFSAHNALYSPKGDDGLPAPLFDPETGKINREIARHWQQYDLTLLVKDNWASLGPKLQDKIYIWMGDMDNFYLNPATRTFDEVIKSLTDPVSDAVIEFEAMAGHCDVFSNERVLKQIEQRLLEVGGRK